MTVFGVVFARGGSKGVPRKNLRTAGGVSLLERSIVCGLTCSKIEEMFCSTDSVEIAEIAEQTGAQVPYLRSARLAADESPEWDSWHDFSEFLFRQGAVESDIFVSLPTTSPMRAQEDILNALEVFDSGDYDVVLGVAEAKHSPWFNMVVRDDSGQVKVALRQSDSKPSRRQDAPSLFVVTTVVYVTSLGYIRRSSGLFEGRVGSVVIPAERSIDIDSEFDLQLADCLLRQKEGT